MAITVQEKIGSPVITGGEDPSAEVTYWIIGTTSEVDAYASLLSQVKSEYLGLVAKSTRLEPSNTANNIWEGSIRYGKRVRPPGTVTLSFDTTGGTQQITQSLGTFDVKSVDGVTAPNFGGAIGVNGDTVEGVSINVPQFTWTETHVFDYDYIPASYSAILYQLTGTVNATPFRWFAAGEVLFLGASGSTRENENQELEWEIAYKFAASPNATGLTVGTITGISKRGWDYLWIRYGDDVDQDAKALVKRPVAAYVEQVYRFSDFGALGIGY